MNKNNIVIDDIRQKKENNIAWQDFPVMNMETERELPGTLGDYFDTWGDYITLNPEK